jgi:uncharacterized membrane protein (DUF4010 family)
MMYLRIIFLAFIFNTAISRVLVIPLFILFAISMVLSKLAFSRKQDTLPTEPANRIVTGNNNPLELKTAAIFGGLFVLFAVITDYVIKTYGNAGVTNLAYIVGITDIDPFLLNLLQHKNSIAEVTAAMAIINATNSNNLLKMVYAITLGSKSLRKKLIVNFLALIFSGLVVSFIFLKLVNP